MKKTVLMLTTILLTTTGYQSFAQVSVPATPNASGGSFKDAGQNITFEYSIGEMAAVTTATHSEIVVTQGVLQPQDAILGNASIFNIQSQVLLYPNPTHNLIFLQPLFPQGGKLSCQLYNTAGKLMQSRTLQLNTGNEKQTFNLEKYSSGMYLLKINYSTQGKEGTTTFKIQKIN
jgi:Secretion system C-terminal sorting domain